MPAIEGLTEMVCAELSQSDEYRDGLETIQSHFDEDGSPPLNVEHMLTHIRGLRAVSGAGGIRGLTAIQLDRLDDAICEQIHRIVDQPLPAPDTPYHQIAAWVDAVRRQGPVEIFTTNYDLLMEQAFEDFQVPYFDGFAGSKRPFFDLQAMEEDTLPTRWARLWKLHGSINWYHVIGRGVVRGAASAPEGGEKRVIHPSHLKYDESRRMPYLAMIDRLRAFLRQPTATLIICGYSFRDQHINEIIVQGLRATQGAIGFALMHGGLGQYNHAVSLAEGCGKLSLLAEDAAVISGKRTSWLRKEGGGTPDNDLPGVAWMRSEDADSGPDEFRARLTLGDFAAFGLFLRELTGQPPEESQKEPARVS